ncbi:hypothetical protein [Bizionia arctica]|uniref:Uncharacterized protein n=1 Tax=Bizionia arctica TaxID=1495645 RepID=A0A917LP14_9FLAO|nr:hypothetical protein [Bizionia arctica]GGG47172.1 hypothetical protein GCM10010976_18260 [Bizionia arctica]
MKYASLLSCLLIVLFSGCNKVKPKGDKEVRAFVKEWNQAHTQLKVAYLERDYMSLVSYYGGERTKSQVQQDKNLLFQQFPNYTQRVLDDQFDITKEAGSYLVTFTNHVSYGGIEADYASYLSLTIKNGAFKIQREGVVEDGNNLDAPIFPSAREDIIFFSNNRQVYGDFNGDGLSDYATVISPELNVILTKGTQYNDAIDCEGGCNSIIKFSNKELEDIKIEESYQSELENLKDLNGDGADEIGYWDIKPTTKSLYVFNPTNGMLLCDPIVINTAIHKNLKLIDVFKKTGPNKITVTRSAEVNGKWVLLSEVITLD